MSNRNSVTCCIVSGWNDRK